MVLIKYVFKTLAVVAGLYAVSSWQLAVGSPGSLFKLQIANCQLQTLFAVAELTNICFVVFTTTFAPASE